MKSRYLEDLREYLKGLKKIKAAKYDKRERKKEQKRTETKHKHLKVLITYLDKDYAEVKKRFAYFLLPICSPYMS
jgi:hypothetical protein